MNLQLKWGRIVGTALAFSLALTAQPWLSGASGQATTDYSQTAAAGKQVHDAQNAINDVRMRINRLRTTVRAQLESQPQWASTARELKKAQADFDAARKAVFARLDKDSKYQALSAERRSAQDTLAAADGSGSSVSDSDISKATDLIFNDGLEMKKMESQALADDAKYGDAKSRLNAAHSKIDQLDEAVTQALEAQADYQQLQQQLDQANQQLAQARQQLAQAAQAERQAREQEEKSREQQQSYGIR